MSKTKKPSVFWNLLGSGLSRRHDLEVLRKVILINFMSFFGGLFLFIFGLYNLYEEQYGLFVADIVTFFILTYNFLALRYGARVDGLAFVSTLFAGLFFLYMAVFGAQERATYLWGLLFPVISMFLMGLKKGGALTLAFLMVLVVSFVFAPYTSGALVLPFSIQARIVAVYLLMSLVVATTEASRARIFKKLDKRKGRIAAQVRRLERHSLEKESLIADLKKTLAEVKVLRGIIPICASCKKIRDDEGYWNQVEHYIKVHSGVNVERWICPDCKGKVRS